MGFGLLQEGYNTRTDRILLMKALGQGKGYRYAHDDPDAYAAGERYFPEAMGERRYYRPVPCGLEIRIGERLSELRARDRRGGSK